MAHPHPIKDAVISNRHPYSAGMRGAVCGIDESGIGSLIGPLVSAAVAIPRDMMPQVRAWGVKDSKILGFETQQTLCKMMTESHGIKCRTDAVQPRDLCTALRKKKTAGRARGHTES